MTEQLIKDDLDGDQVLSDLDDSARQHRFEALQQRMQSVWDAWKLDLDDESVVIVPSVTVIRAVGAGSAITQAFEERLLFLLLLLRQPALRMIYVTSTPDQPAHHRVLPRPAPRGDPEPRDGPADPDLHRRLLRPSAQPEAPGPSPAARAGSPHTSRTARVPTSSPTTPPRSSATSL